MKFDEYELTKDSYGFEFAKSNIMKTDTLRSCMHCRKPTYFIDVFSEGSICSDECEKAWYEYYNGLIEGMDEVI